MIVFVDTTAFYASFDATDRYNAAAARAWSDFLERDVSLVTSNYVIVETSALLQRRLGMAAVKRLYDTFVPLVSVEWVDADLDSAAAESLLAADKRDLSLVDCTSFALMRHLQIRNAFTFDRHFAEQGFTCHP